MEKARKNYKMVDITPEETIELLKVDPINTLVLRGGLYLTPEVVDKIIVRDGFPLKGQRYALVLKLRDLVRLAGFQSTIRWGGLLILSAENGLDYGKKELRRGARKLCREAEDLTVRVDRAALTVEDQSTLDRAIVTANNMVFSVIQGVKGPAKRLFKKTAEKLGISNPQRVLENRD